MDSPFGGAVAVFDVGELTGDSRGSEAPAEPMNLGLTARQMPRPPIFAIKQDGTPPACVVVQPAHDYHLMPSAQLRDWFLPSDVGTKEQDE